MSARFFSLFSVVAIGAALVALVLWLPGYLKPAPAGHITLMPEAGCSVAERACQASGESGAITLELIPTPVHSVTPLQISVNLRGQQADTVQMSLEGQDMYMGINQIQLTQDKQSGLWRGNGELAVCTTGEMAWRARVTAQQGLQLIEAVFDFNAR